MPVRRLSTLALTLLAAVLPAPAAGAATRLPSEPVVSAWLQASGKGATVLAAGRRVPVRRGRPVRLEAVRAGDRLHVSLGDRRWRGRAAGGIRLRGPLRARLVLATRDAPAELIAHRLLAMERRLEPGWWPDGSAPSGRVRRTRDWKRGFYAGAVWRAIEAAPATRRVLAPLGWRATRALWGGEADDIHDVGGFIFGEADGGALRVACAAGGPDCRRAARSLRRAVATLHRLAAATPAGALVVQSEQGCRVCEGDELKVFIDSVMNMGPLMTGGERDRTLAAHHLGYVARELVRADGSTTQQLFLRASTGEVTRRLGHDPLAPESTWSRGQAWAVRGYAEAAQVLGGPWVELAERTADWVAARSAGVPGWDWNLPAGDANPGDTSAAAITAAGLTRLLALRCGAIAAPAAAERCAAWERARDALLATSLAAVSRTPGSLGRFDGQRYLWDRSRRIDYRGEYLMGTVYLLEALASSRGSNAWATTRSTASGASGASASAARSR